jgi:hypothetical protein
VLDNLVGDLRHGETFRIRSWPNPITPNNPRRCELFFSPITTYTGT